MPELPEVEIVRQSLNKKIKQKKVKKVIIRNKGKWDVCLVWTLFGLIWFDLGFMWISICFIWVSFGSMIQKRLPFIGSIHLGFIWVSKKGFYNCASNHSAGKSMKPLPHRQHLHGGCISGGTCSVAERLICWTKYGGEGAFTCEAGVYDGFGIQ